MIFTDEMLDAVKQSLIEGYYDGLTPEEMTALIDRLEMADRILTEYQRTD